MADRDKYGNYVNDKGVTIKINTDKNGNDHISFYGGEVDKPHDAAHVNINYDKESWSSTTHSPDKNDTNSGSGGCYLTSVCMKYFQENFDDNCYEMTVLRWFRDNFVSKEDIEHYYEVAPIIVESINNEEKSDIIYNYIYDNIYFAAYIFAFISAFFTFLGFLSGKILSKRIGKYSFLIGSAFLFIYSLYILTN